VRALREDLGCMALKLHTLDVFTERRFGGNPLAVVHDADALDGKQMQTIARELNLSETVFLLKPANAAHSAKARIFTPGRELPFAGHPTVGTAILLAELRAPLANGQRDAIIVLEQGIGTVRVGVRLRAGQVPFAEFDAPKLPEMTGTLAARDRLADALGLLPREIGFENHTALRVAAGNKFAFVPVTSLEAIARARINAALWPGTFPQSEIDGVYLYTRQCLHTGSAFHARMFAPQLGVPEDPATGSAAVGLAGVVNEFDGLPDGPHKRVIEQGHEMGRPSSIALTLIVEGGKLATVRIGGNAVRVVEGRLET
jgi:trans-2,3-dihydro-3-hydroxyanthranilate isomerase